MWTDFPEYIPPVTWGQSVLVTGYASCCRCQYPKRLSDTASDNFLKYVLPHINVTLKGKAIPVGGHNGHPNFMFCKFGFSHISSKISMTPRSANSEFVTETSPLNNIIINKSMFMEYTCAVHIVKCFKTCIGNPAAVCYGELHLSDNEASCHTATVVDSQTCYISCSCLIGRFLIHSLPKDIL